MSNLASFDGTARVARIAQIFREVDWLVPAFLSSGPLESFADSLDRTPTDQKLPLLRFVLSQTYTPDYLARMFVAHYSEVMHVRDFAGQIDQSIRAYLVGLTSVAITGLIPVIEGIVRGMAIRQNRNVGQGTKKLVGEFDALIEREVKSPHCFDERLAVFEALRDFVRDKFLQNTTTYCGTSEFNRHGILHGVFKNYGDPANFYRLITILDLLCFGIGMIEGKVSCFGPPDTPQSKRLAGEYLRLQGLSEFVVDGGNATGRLPAV